jgi:hypothetical protein
MRRSVIFHPPAPSLPRQALCPCAPARPRACQDRLFTHVRYVEPLSDARTQLGKERVFWRGWGLVDKAFFNILLGSGLTLRLRISGLFGATVSK